MEPRAIVESYVLIGMLYMFVNILVRKLDADDPLLVLFWWFLWPIAMIGLLVLSLQIFIRNVRKRISNHNIDES